VNRQSPSPRRRSSARSLWGEIHPPTAFPNPRTTIDTAALEELGASIRQHGLLQPIVVRTHPAGTGHELIAGSRRVRAAALAQLATIPARVATLDDQGAHEAAIIENLQWENVHPLEEAEAYERVMAHDPLVTADAIAAKVGKSATYVYPRLTLLRLLPNIREAFRNDVITAAHAERLASVPADRQAEAFEQCFYSLLRTDDDSHDRNNLAPMHRLDEWLRTLLQSFKRRPTGRRWPSQQLPTTRSSSSSYLPPPQLYLKLRLSDGRRRSSQAARC
jgi:ParB family chromosome partitioning protein